MSISYEKQNILVEAGQWSTHTQKSHIKSANHRSQRMPILLESSTLNGAIRGAWNKLVAIRTSLFLSSSPI
jgi:hypothetical protein